MSRAMNAVGLSDFSLLGFRTKPSLSTGAVRSSSISWFPSLCGGEIHERIPKNPWFGKRQLLWKEQFGVFIPQFQCRYQITNHSFEKEHLGI